MGDAWRGDSKCLELTPEEADALFFPGSGGKPHKAKKYCSNCPVQGLCLQNAIDAGMAGFHSGTTEEARAAMRKNNFALQFLLASAMPKEPEHKRPVYRKLVVNEDPHSWLGLQGPSDEQIEQQARYLETLN